VHVGDAAHIVHHPYAKFEVRRPSRSEDTATALIGLMTLAVDF